MRDSSYNARILFLGAVVLLCVALALLIRHTQALPRGPLPIVWDREACAECRMHVGEPRFAGQLQTRDGQVLDFDDPGCLLRYLATRKPNVHAVYFHHLTQEQWLPLSEVAFTDVEGTPMGYGLGVVSAGTPGAISMQAALARVTR